VLFLEFARAIEGQQRAYDWNNKVTWGMGVSELSTILASPNQQHDFFHDPGVCGEGRGGVGESDAQEQGGAEPEVCTFGFVPKVPELLLQARRLRYRRSQYCPTGRVRALSTVVDSFLCPCLCGAAGRQGAGG
jgi:hypothetical protein